jgi:Transposase DDE domain
MELAATLKNDWQILLTMFPQNWRELAKSTNAVTRKLRSFNDEESIMRTLLLHVANGYSLRETVTRAKIANISDVSDVALLKRLQCSEEWFKELCLCLLKERGITSLCMEGNIRMRLVDSTNVKEPGKTGSLWRIHYSLLLPNLQCDYFKLTGTSGKGTGESFSQFPVKAGDCIVGDRGYSTAQGIAYLVSQHAHALVRVNTASMTFFSADHNPFNLLTEISKLQEHGTQEWEVMVSANGILIPGRVCVVRKSQASIIQALKKIKRKSSRRQTKTNQSTLEFAKYVILFTTLPQTLSPLPSILAWYRFRWQIELVFKRLKSLAGLGHLPKHDDASARAWLYGKLFTGLLVDKLMHHAKTLSPWGYV